MNIFLPHNIGQIYYWSTFLDPNLLDV